MTALDRIAAAGERASLVAADAQARSRWDRVLAGGNRSDQTSWQSHGVLSESEWLAGLWNRASRTGAHAPTFVLSADQSQWLWQRVIEASAPGKTLIDCQSIARRSREARRDLLNAGLEPARQSGALWQQDRAAFLEFNRAFEKELEARHWIDPESLLFRLNRLPPATIAGNTLLLDPGGLSNEQQRLIRQWQQAGFDIEVCEPDDHDASVSGTVHADSIGEISAAASWAQQRLDSGSATDLAIVIPDLEQRLDEIETAFADRLGRDRVYSSTGRPIDRIGIFAAAINALELLGPGAGFEQASRWLRSPYFATEAEPSDAAATAELELRADLRSQTGFFEAWHRFGLRRWLAERLPQRSAAIDSAFGTLPDSASPTAWTAVWQDCLKLLHWQGFTAELPAGLQQAWEKGWARFSALTAVTGRLDRNAALSTLKRVMATETTYQRAKLSGVSLFRHIEEIGPGFDGAWIAGFSDESLPAPGRANPLIPWAVLLEHRMPGADPAHELTEAQAAFGRIRRRVPELRLSCPKRIDDQPCSPNPLFDDWRDASASAKPVSQAPSHPAARIGARDWQIFDSVAPPLDSSRIPGGVRTLDLQAACPAKAFCVSRLKAEPLEPPARGIDARLRGIIVHRALETLLAPESTAPPDTRLDACLNRVLGPLERTGDAFWQTQLDAEKRRLKLLLNTFLAAEENRSEFSIVAVERKTEISLETFELKGRIDRIDQLASGERMLIDYKTGSIANTWFEPRLASCQLPLYLQAQPAAAIVMIRLDADKSEYAGAGLGNCALPGKYRTFDETAWAKQIDDWRRVLVKLLGEFAAGDTRVTADAGDHVASDRREYAGGAFAPVTRVGELK